LSKIYLQLLKKINIRFIYSKIQGCWDKSHLFLINMKLWLKRCSPKKANSVINYSALCRSKLVSSFVHLWNTNEDIFDEIWEISVPPHIYATDTLMLLKVHKEIVKLIHMNWAVYSKVFWRDTIALYDEQI